MLEKLEKLEKLENVVQGDGNTNRRAGGSQASWDRLGYDVFWLSILGGCLPCYAILVHCAYQVVVGVLAYLI